MLMKNNAAGTNYLADWPAHYYEIEDINERQRILLLAIEKELDPEHDPLRLSLLKMRFGDTKAKERPDAFLNAFMMIKAASAAGISRLRKKRQKKELCGYLAQLGITNPADGGESTLMPFARTEAALTVLTEEWQNFADVFLASCVGSKGYRSTLFGIVPIRESAVAEKIAADIDLVTRLYPAQFGLEEALLPFRRIMADAFCEKIENGRAYWDALPPSIPPHQNF